MTDEQKEIRRKNQWIADLRDLVDFLDAHPELIGRWEHVMVSTGTQTPEEAEKLLPLLPDRDCTDDPALFFGDHYVYMRKKYTKEGMIEDLQNIVAETA